MIRHNPLTTPLLRQCATVAIIVAALLAGWQFRPETTTLAQSTTTLRSYTIVLDEQVSKIGVKGFSHTYTYARRNDGSRLFRVNGPVGRADEKDFRVIDFRVGVRAEIRDLAELKSTRIVRHQPTTRSIANSCLFPGEVSAGEDVISGNRAYTVKRGGRTSWFAAELDCALLKERIESEGGVITEKTLRSLSIAEPDATLFHVPQSYKEVPPSAIAFTYSVPPNDERTKRHFERLDKEYADNRPTAEIQHSVQARCRDCSKPAKK